jgi:2-dehydropantoate 2-reductase
MTSDPRVLVFGAGAVGATVGGWLAERYESVWFLDVPPVVEALTTQGLTLYQGGNKERGTTIRVKAVSDLAQAPRPDILILAVKTYSLEKVSTIIKDKLGGGPLPIVVALQNGVDNQTILPPHFPRVVYGVVGYNAWIDEPGVVGYQKKGPLVLGTIHNELSSETRDIAALLGRGVETIVTDRLEDAAWSKMVVNLTNSLQALIGHPFKPLTNRALFQRLLTNLTYEGVTIVKAAGRHECRIGGMPSWWLMWAATKLPRVLTQRAFEKNVEKMVISSMAQDVLQRGGTDSELETLNGRFIRVADEHHLAVPYNRAIYALCQERFGKPGFTPLSLEEVWAEVQRRTRSQLVGAA